MSSALPVSTISSSLVGLESRSTILPASLAACVPLFIATATSAWASAGASLVPSPVMATRRPSAWYCRISLSLSSGVASARKSSTPASAAMAAAVSLLSPVIITVLMPMRRSSPKRSLMPDLTMSLSSTTPRIFLPSLTASGVLPRRDTSSEARTTSLGTLPPSASTCLRMASTAPLRSWRVLPSACCTSIPLMRVCAVKATSVVAPTKGVAALSFCASVTILRPSGVSSAVDACMAHRASMASVTPGAGRKLDAWRLPCVMVPVLSSISTSTSPAASTARPDVAITLACIMRLMPATPTADNRPPMVVGIRQTSKATSAVRLTTVPAPAAPTLKIENGNKVTVTTKNTIVKATSKIVRAISLGVLARLAPSTMLIMRSRNDSPGLTEIRTTSQSDSTRVPPVTDEKSPPDSRTTGADSPVMALSSTVATPSMTSPSSGIMSPVSMKTTSPLRRFSA